jgi:hypothetical protein
MTMDEAQEVARILGLRDVAFGYDGDQALITLATYNLDGHVVGTMVLREGGCTVHATSTPLAYPPTSAAFITLNF